MLFVAFFCAYIYNSTQSYAVCMLLVAFCDTTYFQILLNIALHSMYILSTILYMFSDIAASLQKHDVRGMRNVAGQMQRIMEYIYMNIHQKVRSITFVHVATCYCRHTIIIAQCAFRQNPRIQSIPTQNIFPCLHFVIFFHPRPKLVKQIFKQLSEVSSVKLPFFSRKFTTLQHKQNKC